MTQMTPDSSAPPANSAPPVTRSSTEHSIATTVPVDNSAGDLAENAAVNLADFFGDAPNAYSPAPLPVYPTPIPATSPASKGKARQRNASPGPSAAPAPVLAVAAKRFLDALQLADLPASDKRFDGKTETRGLQREVHAFVQRVAQFYAEEQGHRAETVSALDGFRAQLLEVASVLRQSASADDVAAAIGGFTQLADRLNAVELGNTRISAQLDTLFSTVQSLVHQRNSQQPATTSHVPAEVVPIAAPAPVTAAATVSPEDSRVAQLEAMLLDLTRKRGRSPSNSDEARSVRPRIEDAAPAAAIAPAFAPVGAAPAPAMLPSASSLTAAFASSAPPAFAHQAPAAFASSAPPAFAPPAPAAFVAPAPAPALAPTPFLAPGPGPAQPSAVAGPMPAPAHGPPPPALPPTDHTKEVRLGPATWGKNITGEATTVIKTVLPAARSVMRNFRARRGPDSQTVIACFETAEIAAWLIPAFNASRVAPFQAILASPNM